VWSQVASNVFDGRVSNHTVQSHANRYSNWMKSHGVVDKHTALLAQSNGLHFRDVHKGKSGYQVPRMHIYLRMNEYTLDEWIDSAENNIVLVNGIPYRLKPEGPCREDEIFKAYGLPNSFTVLQALDGYNLGNHMEACRLSTDCPLIQQQCQEGLSLQHISHPDSRALISMSRSAYAHLCATRVNVVDNSISPWHGKAPLALSIKSLVTTPTPSISIVTDLSHEPVHYNHTPQLEELTYEEILNEGVVLPDPDCGMQVSLLDDLIDFDTPSVHYRPSPAFVPNPTTQLANSLRHSFMRCQDVLRKSCAQMNTQLNAQ